VDDGLEQALSLLIGAAASVLLLWGNYRWGGRRRKDEIEYEHDHEKENDDA
jgi:hypothetical protein